MFFLFLPFLFLTFLFPSFLPFLLLLFPFLSFLLLILPVASCSSQQKQFPSCPPWRSHSHTSLPLSWRLCHMNRPLHFWQPFHLFPASAKPIMVIVKTMKTFISKAAVSEC